MGGMWPDRTAAGATQVRGDLFFDLGHTRANPCPLQTQRRESIEFASLVEGREAEAREVKAASASFSLSLAIVIYLYLLVIPLHPA